MHTDYLCCLLGLFLLTDAQQLSAGSNADLGEYPYMASIRTLGSHYCGGTIIHAKWILTAAHCIFNQTESELSVVVGSTLLDTGGDFYRVKWMLIHELYEYVPDDVASNDIGMLFLKDPINFNANVQKAKLASTLIQPGLNTVLIGWPKLPKLTGSPSNSLKSISLSTIGKQECAKLLSRRKFNIGNFCTSVMRGEAGCYGDNGSPITEVLSGEVIGIHSWSMSPCGTSALPDGYTNVWEYLDWIDVHIAIHK